MGGQRAGEGRSERAGDQGRRKAKRKSKSKSKSLEEEDERSWNSREDP